jgi:hypothetical protein
MTTYNRLILHYLDAATGEPSTILVQTEEAERGAVVEVEQTIPSHHPLDSRTAMQIALERLEHQVQVRE